MILKYHFFYRISLYENSMDFQYCKSFYMQADMEKKCENIWSECMSLLRNQVIPERFETIFAPIKALDCKGNVLSILVGSSYVCETIEKDYIHILGPIIKKVMGTEARLEYKIIVEKSEPSDPLIIRRISAPLKENKASTVLLNKQDRGLKNPFEPQKDRIHIDSRLNPASTMEDFIEGDCNRLARSAGMAIAMNPGGTAFNPLLIYGGSGLGKTHLAQAIGLEIKQNHPEKVVLYVSANLFVSQFMEAVRRNEINDFIHFYQLMDVLILDDIQELAGKTGTQNTFFHLFNHLHQLGKQLILTSDKSPADLEGLEDRLLTRFRWGLSAELKIPDYNTRKKIVLHKAQKDGIEFPSNVVDYICRRVNTSVREIEGSMISLLAHSTFNKRQLTIELAEKVLDKMVKQKREELTLDKIQNTVSEYYKIPVSSLKDKSRKREIAQARQIVMYFVKNYTNASLSFIGSQFNRNHATVLHACNTVENLMDTDKGFKLQMDDIRQMLNITT